MMCFWGDFKIKVMSPEPNLWMSLVLNIVGKHLGWCQYTSQQDKEQRSSRFKRMFAEVVHICTLRGWKKSLVWVFLHDFLHENIISLDSKPCRSCRSTSFPASCFLLSFASQVLDRHRAMDSMVELLQVYPEEDEAYGGLLEATTQLYHYLLQPFRDMRELAMLRRQQIKVIHTDTHTHPNTICFRAWFK